MTIKKITSVLLTAGLIVSLTSCNLLGGSSFYKQGVEALERGDYETAEDCFFEAMNSESGHKNSTQLYDMISNYNNAEECIKNNDYKTAKEYFDDIPKLYKSYDLLDSDVEDMEEIMDDYEDAIEEYKKAYNYYKSGLYTEAKVAVASVDKKYLTDIQQKNVDTIMRYDTSTDVQQVTPQPQPKPAPVQQPVSDSEVRSLMNDYAWSLVDAINTNDFSKVSHTLYPGSNLYTTQKNLVTNLNKQGITENMDYLEVTSITWTSATNCTITTNEAAYIHNANGNTEHKTYRWKYTASMDGNTLKLTSIARN